LSIAKLKNGAPNGSELELSAKLITIVDAPNYYEFDRIIKEFFKVA